MENENYLSSSSEPKEDFEHIPSELDAAAIETWLEDKAADGWRLTGFDRRFWRVAGKFDKAEPCLTRYRLTPLPRKERKPEEEQRELCEAQGWRYVATIPYRFHIWRTDDETVPEMDTDPVTQAEGYRYLRRRSWWEFFSNGLIFAFLVGLLLVLNWVTSGGMLLAYTEGGAPGEFFIMLSWCIGGAVLAVYQILALRRLYRRLHTGIPMDRPAPYRLKQAGRRVLWLVALVSYFYFIGNGMFGVDEYKWIDQDPKAMAKANYVSAASLGDFSSKPELDAKRKSLPLFPELYQVREYALRPDDPADFGLSEMSSWHTEYYIITDYYRTVTPWLAEELERELLRQAARDQEKHPSWYPALSAVETPALDGFSWGSLPKQDIRDWDNTQRVVARLGNCVLTVLYTGPADLREKTDALASVLSEQS